MVYVCVSIALVWLTFSRDDIWILSFSELYLVNLWDVDIGASALERLVIATAECNAINMIYSNNKHYNVNPRQHAVHTMSFEGKTQEAKTCCSVYPQKHLFFTTII